MLRLSGCGIQGSLLGWQKFKFMGSNMFLGNDFHLDSIRRTMLQLATVSLDHRMVATKMCVRQGTLQKFLRISIKNSKCAVSNKHIQDGRPGGYENRRVSKIKAKQHQKTPTPTQERESQRCHHPEGERIRKCASWQQKDRVSAEKCRMKPLCPKMRNDARGQTDEQT